VGFLIPTVEPAEEEEFGLEPLDNALALSDNELWPEGFLGERGAGIRA